MTTTRLSILARLRLLFTGSHPAIEALESKVRMSAVAADLAKAELSAATTRAEYAESALAAALERGSLAEEALIDIKSKIRQEEDVKAAAAAELASRRECRIFNHDLFFFIDPTRANVYVASRLASARIDQSQPFEWYDDPATGARVFRQAVTNG